jgi:hypothetical protein
MKHFELSNMGAGRTRLSKVVDQELNHCITNTDVRNKHWDTGQRP